MKKKSKFGFLSQGYAAPRAESVEMMIEGNLLLTASDGSEDTYSTTQMEGVNIDGWH